MTRPIQLNAVVVFLFPAAAAYARESANHGAAESGAHVENQFFARRLTATLSE